MKTIKLNDTDNAETSARGLQNLEGEVVDLGFIPFFSVKLVSSSKIRSRFLSVED
jgi:hypothetical protein